MTPPAPLPPRARCRYNLPVCVLVFNNSGIYGGDRREQRLRQLAEEGEQPSIAPPAKKTGPLAQQCWLGNALGRSRRDNRWMCRPISPSLPACPPGCMLILPGCALGRAGALLWPALHRLTHCIDRSVQAWQPPASQTTRRPPPLCLTLVISCSWRRSAAGALRWPPPTTCRCVCAACLPGRREFLAGARREESLAYVARTGWNPSTVRLLLVPGSVLCVQLQAAPLSSRWCDRGCSPLPTPPPSPVPVCAVGATRSAGHPAAYSDQCAAGSHGWGGKR